MIADAAEVGLRLAHQLLVLDVHERHRPLAQHARERGHVAGEERVVVERHLVVAVEERLDPGGEDGERVARQDHVVRLRVEPGQERQHEGVGRGLVEEEALAGRGREHAAVERVGVGAQRVQVVLLAARQVGDQLADRLLGVLRVVGRLLDLRVVAQVRDRRDEVRLGALIDGRVRAQHARQQRRAGARRPDQEDETLLHLTAPRRGASRAASRDRRPRCAASG